MENIIKSIVQRNLINALENKNKIDLNLLKKTSCKWKISIGSKKLLNEKKKGHH